MAENAIPSGPSSWLSRWSHVAAASTALATALGIGQAAAPAAALEPGYNEPEPTYDAFGDPEPEPAPEPEPESEFGFGGMYDAFGDPEPEPDADPEPKPESGFGGWYDAFGDLEPATTLNADEPEQDVEPKNGELAPNRETDSDSGYYAEAFGHEFDTSVEPLQGSNEAEGEEEEVQAARDPQDRFDEATPAATDDPFLFQLVDPMASTALADALALQDALADGELSPAERAMFSMPRPSFELDGRPTTREQSTRATADGITYAQASDVDSDEFWRQVSKTGLKHATIAGDIEDFNTNIDEGDYTGAAMNVTTGVLGLTPAKPLALGFKAAKATKVTKATDEIVDGPRAANDDLVTTISRSDARSNPIAQLPRAIDAPRAAVNDDVVDSVSQLPGTAKFAIGATGVGAATAGVVAVSTSGQPNPTAPAIGDSPSDSELPPVEQTPVDVPRFAPFTFPDPESEPTPLYLPQPEISEPGQTPLYSPQTEISEPEPTRQPEPELSEPEPTRRRQPELFEPGPTPLLLPRTDVPGAPDEWSHPLWSPNELDQSPPRPQVLPTYEDPGEPQLIPDGSQRQIPREQDVVSDVTAVGNNSDDHRSSAQPNNSDADHGAEPSNSDDTDDESDPYDKSGPKADDVHSGRPLPSNRGFSYRVVPPTYAGSTPNSRIFGSIDGDGFVKFRIRSTTHRQGDGTTLFNELLNEFQNSGYPIEGIMGRWGKNSTNTEVFEQAQSEDGTSREEAALLTPTGKWASRAGFGQVEIKSDPGSNQLRVYFRPDPDTSEKAEEQSNGASKATQSEPASEPTATRSSDGDEALAKFWDGLPAEQADDGVMWALEQQDSPGARAPIHMSVRPNGSTIAGLIDETGFVRFNVESQEKGDGTELFNEMLTDLQSKSHPITGIRGRWIRNLEDESVPDSTNLTVFENAIKNGRSPEEAALQTPTGKWASRAGYPRVEIERVFVEGQIEGASVYFRAASDDAD